MKIATCNLRYQNPWDGANGFEFRFPYIIERIQKERPDVIGFQEMLPEMAEKIKAALPEYNILGHGREEDLTGEQTAVGFLHSRFDLVQMRSFWLSETPDVPGSRYEGQSPCPRTCTYLTLYAPKERTFVRVYNTHLDHSGSEARARGLRQILCEMRREDEKKSIPALLMGDFNAEPQSPEMECLKGNSFLTDQTERAGGTFHQFGTKNPPSKIDYIFATSQWQQQKEAVLWKEDSGIWLSDHFPVCVELSLK